MLISKKPLRFVVLIPVLKTDEPIFKEAMKKLEKQFTKANRDDIDASFYMDGPDTEMPIKEKEEFLIGGSNADFYCFLRAPYDVDPGFLSKRLNAIKFAHTERYAELGIERRKVDSHLKIVK